MCLTVARAVWVQVLLRDITCCALCIYKNGKENIIILFSLSMEMVSALNSRASGPGSSLAEDIALCSWAKHFLVVPLSTQVYNMGTTEFNSGGKPALD